MSENALRIKLTEDLPIEPKHQALAGNVYDAKETKKWRRGAVRWWIIGATGEKIGVLNHEAEVVKEQQ